MASVRNTWFGGLSLARAMVRPALGLWSRVHALQRPRNSKCLILRSRHRTTTCDIGKKKKHTRSIHAHTHTGKKWLDVFFRISCSGAGSGDGARARAISHAIPTWHLRQDISTGSTSPVPAPS